MMPFSQPLKYEKATAKANKIRIASTPFHQPTAKIGSPGREPFTRYSCGPKSTSGMSRIRNN